MALLVESSWRMVNGMRVVLYFQDDQRKIQGVTAVVAVIYLIGDSIAHGTE